MSVQNFPYLFGDGIDFGNLVDFAQLRREQVEERVSPAQREDSRFNGYKIYPIVSFFWFFHVQN